MLLWYTGVYGTLYVATATDYHDCNVQSSIKVFRTWHYTAG